MHYAALAGGALSMLGSFLPWVSFGGIITWPGINGVDGTVVVAVGLCAAVLATYNLHQKADRFVQAYAVCGLLNLGIVIFYVTEIKRRLAIVAEGIELFFDIRGAFLAYINIIGMGIWLVGIGAVILIGAAFLLYQGAPGQKRPFHRPDAGRSGPEPNRQPVYSRKSFLGGITGTYAGQQIPIPREGILIGRDSTQCTLVLTSPSVSRRHARLSPGPSPDYWVLEDLNSTNGTFIQEGASWTRVTSPVTLGIFRKLRIGDDGNEFEIR